MKKSILALIAACVFSASAMASGTGAGVTTTTTTTVGAGMAVPVAGVVSAVVLATGSSMDAPTQH